jgi:putative ABC transport system permease protein
MSMTNALREFGEAVRQGGSSAVSNPLRAGLGALAIAAAVATIVVVITALDGLSLYARTASARSFGSDTFLLAQIASAGQVNRRELAAKQLRNPPIRKSDLRFLERYAGDGVLYGSTAQRVAGVTSGSNEFENAAVTGATASLAELRDLGIGRGRFFTRDEEQRGALVAVVGADVADALFPARDPLGAPLRIAGRRFEVVGAQARLGASGGTSLDRSVWIPLAAFERAFGAPETISIFVKAADFTRTQAAEDQARAALRARRQLRPGVADNFDILTPEGARSFVQNVSERVGAAAGPISAMALLAAIVVVTNTMLVSVTQKTREIGVRRALGATRRQLIREVVSESVLVALGGGLAGIVLTVLAVDALSGALDLGLRVRAATIAWAIAASALSGILAGLYPARRATRVDIIAAVRAE